MAAAACTAASGLALATAVGGVAHSQAIERNLPPTPQAAPSEILAPNVVPASQDDRPVGPALAAIVALGPGDAAAAAPGADALDLHRVARLDTPAGRDLLKPYLGRPLSHRLIAQVEASIARYYRQRRFPFVSLSTPPQELTAGVLQVRVLEFKAGRVDVTGVQPAEAAYVKSRVRLQPGQPVDAANLAQDLDWLNRDPFRQVDAVFQPGAAPGRTDLDLQAHTTRPFQVYAGYANSGSPSTGWDRYFIGGQAAAPFLRDAVASYQFTASSDFFDDGGRALGDTDHPRYASHAVRLYVPTAPRQALELSFDTVQTNVALNQLGVVFDVRQETYEAVLSYRSALSNFVPAPGDVSLGVEVKRESRRTFFEGVDVLDNAVNVDQLYGGWAGSWVDPAGRSSLDVNVHGSPGGVDRPNGSQAFAVFSNGRVTDAAYGYVNLVASRYTRLPGGWAWTESAVGQYAGAPLPDTEQLGVGGQSLVRGYTLDDGAYDTAAVLRSELRAPAAAVLQRVSARLPDALSAFGFVDAGTGRSYVVRLHSSAVSAGLGGDYQLGTALTATVTAAHDFPGSVSTRSGSWLVQSRVTLTF